MGSWQYCIQVKKLTVTLASDSIHMPMMCPYKYLLWFEALMHDHSRPTGQGTEKSVQDAVEVVKGKGVEGDIITTPPPGLE